jgi:hypothetical protein
MEITRMQYLASIAWRYDFASSFYNAAMFARESAANWGGDIGAALKTTTATVSPGIWPTIPTGFSMTVPDSLS